ncbi:hypothetical protein [Rhizobium binxianense]
MMTERSAGDQALFDELIRINDEQRPKGVSSGCCRFGPDQCRKRQLLSEGRA